MRLPPINPTLPRLTECVRTHSPSASTKGSGIWWSYTGDSPDRPWRLLSCGLSWMPASVAATATSKPPQTRGQADSYQQALGGDGPLQMSTGRGARHFSTKVPAASFPVLQLGLGVSFRRPAQKLRFRGGLLKRQIVHKASSLCT